MFSATAQSHMATTNPREFIRLLMENERRIHAYIFTLVGNRADADDLLQETSLVLWDKFSEFSGPDENFIRWAFRVAWLTCQNFRRRKGRSKLLFSNELAEKIADRVTDITSELDQRKRLLDFCLNKLTPNDRELLQLRYEIGASIESTAERAGRTQQAVYKALSRLRASLYECVNRQMSWEDQS